MVESDKTGIFYVDPSMVDMIPISDIKPYKRNAKKHPQEQIEQIINSINAFGMNDPIGVWGDENIIVEGHGRYLALREMGENGLVPVIHLDNLTDEQRKAYALAHNKLTMNTDFDSDALSLEMDDLSDFFDMSDFGFDDMFDAEPGTGSDHDVVEDEVPEVEDVEPVCKRGQIWQLGKHRLMCGDSTSEEDVKKLLGGEYADLLITDLPYNVDYGNKAERFNEYFGGDRNVNRIMNDNMGDQEFLKFLTDAFSCADKVMRPGAAFYIWHADVEGYNFRGACRKVGWEIRQCLVWNKNSLVMGRQDYQWKHEPCLYGWKAGAGHTWLNDRKQTTVMEFDRPMKNDIHPTMKPVKLFDYQICNSCPVDGIALDLFGGSGTTIMACEQNGRRGRLMELDPHYCDVIIKRWEDFTGQKAELIEE